MPNIALLVGNTEYRSLARLDCCAADVGAMKELLGATEKYESIITIENASSNDLKDGIRTAIDKVSSCAELFFYYTGHGYAYESEFFYCATDFDSNRPNETGLSTTDLHTLLRLPSADLVIKVVDACNSGMHLIKADMGLSQHNKQGFKNLIQISSCLDNQSSLTGHPLSQFTQKFRDAALSKVDGIVYYTDIIAVLRDQFISNDTQTPFVVSQYTGREQFIDDAHKLQRLRDALREGEIAETAALTVVEATTARPPPTLPELLATSEAKLVTQERMNAFVGTFFDNLKGRLSTSEFGQFFDVEFVEHDDFKEPTATRQIIEVLNREKRPDNFVTAEISQKQRRRNPFFSSAVAALSNWYDDEQFVEVHDLSLNCEMERSQLRVTFTPKYTTLQRIILVSTCAPSLDACYVFEAATQHMLRDFGKYDVDGTTIVKRWYKFDWSQSTDFVVGKISETLLGSIRAHIENAAKRLSANT